MSCGEKLYLLDFCILLIRVQLIMFVLYVLTFILSLCETSFPLVTQIHGLSVLGTCEFLCHCPLEAELV